MFCEQIFGLTKTLTKKCEQNQYLCLMYPKKLYDKWLNVKRAHHL